MGSNKPKLILALAACTLMLQGCMSRVHHIHEVDGHQVQHVDDLMQSGFSKISIAMSDEAKAKHANNLKFNPKQLMTVLDNALDTQGFLKSDSPYRIDVLVTNIRTRSNYTAVALGWMAGADRLQGRVTVRDLENKPVRSFVVSADYALGGIGGLDGSRMSWLYEKFAQHVIEQLQGKAPSKPEC